MLDYSYYKVKLYYKSYQMFDWLRKLVAGPKNRTVFENYDLDLTYITPNIIAMAFPATGLEQLFRNCLEDVVAFLQKNHQGKYYIINVSNREYDAQYFEGRVKSYEWNDHQAPCLTTLFQIADFSSKYLKSNEDNVVIFHCNHGKGRTGTAIMSLLMYLQDFENSTEVLNFYNEKRFKTKKYVCSQPCQVRYLKFYDQIMKNSANYQFIKAYRLVSIKHEGLSDNYYLNITEVRNNKIIYTKANFHQVSNLPENHFLMGDIFIEVYKSGFIVDTRICRINYHMQFVERNENKWIASFQGSQLSLQNCQSSNFILSLQFEQYCGCHIKQQWKSSCNCFKQRQKQEWHWSKMHHTIRNRPRRIHNDYTFANNGSQEPIDL